MNTKPVDPYIVLFRPNIPLADDTEPLADLTPSDLREAGYFVRAHRFAGFWCWWKQLDGGGQMFGEPRLDIEAVCESARHHMGRFHGPHEEGDGLISYFNGINRAELERWSP